VHLWWRRAGEGDSQGTERASLSDEERRRGERFRREADARAFVARRAFLRSILGAYLDRAPAELEFAAGSWGKPRLAGAGEDLTFNLSSRGEWLLLAVGRGRAVGVDVELLDERLREPEELSRLAQRVLHPQEREAFLSLAEAERPGAFLRAWTRKEALLKALGTGLSREPDSVAVGLAPLGPLEVRVLGPELFPSERGGRLLDLLAPADHAACLVAEGGDWNLVLHSRQG